MTRYTNLGRKRAYVDAGMSYREDAGPHDASEAVEASTSTAADAPAAVAEPSGASEPPKKKRRRGAASNQKRDAKRGEGTLGEGEGEGGQGVEKTAIFGDAPTESGEKKESNKAKKLRQFKEKQKTKRNKDRAAASEKRRLKRIAERHANKVCYACREMGHAAQLCPNVKPEDQANGGNPGTFCYRCGSTKHTLSRCRKPENTKNPMPFASCFVCSGKGHLASGCPQNQSKGIYPNGGSCKLCSETTHLAINCPLRQTDPGLVAAVFGTGREAGADEDDFHTVRRKNVEVDREVMSEEKRKKMAEIRAGKHSGAVRVFGPMPAPVKAKKVVTF
ncbi:hypothetical protein PENSPDRAFT_676897 [Peniophora sp. CONT]|nr:hypothetical protein PENSPDRAFT_676897 [Peniophora sp. CONT]